jgi:amino acid adenylation domain-containing protein
MSSTATNSSSWTELLKGFTAATPIPLARKLLGGAVGAERAQESTELPTAAARRIASFASERDLAVPTLLRGVWAILLARYSGESDVVFGTVRNGGQPIPFRVQVPAASALQPWLLELRGLEASLPEQAPPANNLFHSVIFVDEVDPRSVKQPLALVVRVREDALGLSIIYDPESFDAEAVRRMLGHARVLLDSIVSTPDERLARLSVLTEAESHDVTVTWNATRKEFPAGRLEDVIFAQAQRTPNAVAVRFEKTQLTYAQLMNRASQLGRYLVRRGAGPEKLVAFCLDRSIDMLVTLLGILESGSAYLPIDPELPRDRIAYMLEDSKAVAVVTQETLARILPETSAPSIKIDSDQGEISREPASRVPDRRTTPDDLAYVLYTSGSTGKPKGVEVLHRGLVSFMESMRLSPGFAAQDRILAITTISFDIAGLELFLPLTVGGEIVIGERRALLDGSYLRTLLDETRPTVLQATPVTWRVLLASGWGGDKEMRAFCGGEPLPRDLATQILSKTKALYNLYGPTETTIWSSVEEVAPEGPISIGKPIANTKMYVVDKERRLVPVGALGELLIGGVGVARGYINRPELTSEKFITDPFSSEPNERAYFTGDLVRQLADGRFEHHGRMDFQVKIRGFRIELGEIEAALSRHTNVKEAVVIAREDVPGEKRLAAYIIPRTRPEPPSQELRTHLLASLPEYMVPLIYVTLDVFPLTPNQKVDRKALPAPVRAPANREIVAARDILEQNLVDIWEKVLHTKPVGVREDLMLDLGADSISAVTAASLVEKQLQLEVTPEVFGEHRTIEGQAAALRSGSKTRFNAPLVTLIQGKPGTDFFLVHAAGGDGFAYMPLARRLDGTDTIHVVQNRFRERPEAMFRNIEEMAADYVSVLEAKLPDGPYRLGGWSLGATVAFEMAAQLAACGKKVSGVLLFDPPKPLTGGQRMIKALERWGSTRRYRLAQGVPGLATVLPGIKGKIEALRGQPPLQRLVGLIHLLAYAGVDDKPAFVEELFPGVISRGDLETLPPDVVWERLHARLKADSTEAVDTSLGVPGASITSLRRRARVFGLEHKIEASYSPRGSFPGSLTMFLVRGNTESLFWKSFAGQPCSIEEFDIQPTKNLPAHNAMMQELNVDQFAASVQAFLARTRSV